MVEWINQFNIPVQCKQCCIGSCGKRNSQVRLHVMHRFLQSRECGGKHESWHGMSQGSLWRLHTLLAAAHCFPFMHYIKFLSWSTFYVWNRRGIVIVLEKHYLQILKLSNMTEEQIGELYVMLKLDLKIRYRPKKNLVSSVFPVYATKYFWPLHPQ